MTKSFAAEGAYFYPSLLARVRPDCISFLICVSPEKYNGRMSIFASCLALEFTSNDYFNHVGSNS